jgi:hypothetical protein
LPAKAYGGGLLFEVDAKAFVNAVALLIVGGISCLFDEGAEVVDVGSVI